MSVAAFLSPDGQTVMLSGPRHTSIFSVEALPRRLAFYRRMRDRRGGRYARFYKAHVAALEAL